MTRSGEFYLVVAPGKWSSELKARLTNKAPSLDSGEVAVKLNIRVPDTLFKRPQLQASIVIPEDAVSKPVIAADVLDNVQQVLSQQTGLDIKVAVIEPTQIA